MHMSMAGQPWQESAKRLVAAGDCACVTEDVQGVVSLQQLMNIVNEVQQDFNDKVHELLQGLHPLHILCDTVSCGTPMLIRPLHEERIHDELLMMW